MFLRPWYAAVLIALFFGMACRKDSDEDAPRVEILQPGNGITLQVPDTLVVQVSVSDERQVERVTIALNDANGVPAVPSVSVTVDAASTTVVRELPVSSERLSTGSYTLSVAASDGSNVGRAFSTVNVQAAPLRLRALYITPPFGHPAPVPVWRVDSTGSISQFLTLSESGGSAIDADRLYLAGTMTQALQGIPQAGGSAAVNIMNQSPAGSTEPFFLGLTVDPGDGYFYYATNDGFIRGINGSGVQAFTAQSPVDYLSMHTAVMGNTLASAAQHRVLDNWQLITHAIPGGAVLGQFPLDLEPVDLVARNDQQVIVFGNRGSVGVVQQRNVVWGGGGDLYLFNNGPVQALAQLNSSTFIIALPDGLVRYSTASNSITLVAQGMNARSLAYDAASGILHAGVGNELLAVDPLTGASTVLHVLPHAVGSILPLLNR